MAKDTLPPVDVAPATVEERVLEIVRRLAEEVGGARASRATAPDASLERDLGLGSLERVELLLRLETAFGRALGDDALAIDTPAGFAGALAQAGAQPASVPKPAAGTTSRAAAKSLPESQTLHESLWRRAEAEPNRPHAYLQEEGREEILTFGSLREQAASVAGGLREHGIRRGDTVALMLPTGVDFLVSFQGILLAGAIPVPIYPPVRLDRLEEYAERQSAILRDASARALVTVDRARPIAGLLKPAVRSLSIVATAKELADLGHRLNAPEGSNGDPGLIQYTSGSTGRPKGVLLTQANLLANIAAIGKGVQVRPTDVGACWLPLYHDMGLIGSWLFCLHHGLPIVLFSPLSFLARPERWLWAIHTHQATLSAAPNFAYELCVRKISDAAIEGLTLESWRAALNGAEPVSPETIDRFMRRFGAYGFRRTALMPVYGLAESSVALAFPPLGREPVVRQVDRDVFEREGRAMARPERQTGALRFVSVGRPLPEHEVRIVDDGGADLPAGTVGRLVFRGPSVTPGYYGQEEATRAVSLDGGWLDSGDLAFVLDEELHIAGRRKDLIIKAGRNLVPQEIEELTAGVEGIRRGCVVAIGIPHATLGTESLVIVAETRESDPARRDALVSAITERVSAALDLPPDVVCLVAPGAVPKTPSGKVRRSETRELFVKGGLGRVPRTALSTKLRLLTGLLATRMRRLGVLLGRGLYGAYLALVALLVFLPLWTLAVLIPGRKIAVGLGRIGARTLLRLSGCSVEISGAENLAGRGPFVLAANHASYVDVPVLMTLPFDFVFVAKKEVFSWPIVSPYVRKTGQLAVDRWDTTQSVADAESVVGALASGRSVLFFPEGTFTAATGLRPFRLGAFKAAMETGASIVPVALQGSRHVLRADAFLPRPAKIRVWIGPEMRPEAEGFEALLDFRDRVADMIATHAGEPRLNLVAGGPPAP